MEILNKTNSLDKKASVTFGADGHVDASDRSDAIRRIAKYVKAGDEGSRGEKISDLFSQEDQVNLTNRFASQNARYVIGQAMASPLKTFLEYKGVMRKALRVDPLAPGALPVYDRDTEEISADIIAAQSAIDQTPIVGERIYVPMFEIATYPTVKLREIKIRRFNMIDRIQVRARQFMQETEDAMIINVLNAASTRSNTAVTVDTSDATGTGNGLGYIRRSDFVKLSRQITRHDLFAKSYFMSIYRYSDIEMWGRDELDILTQKQIIDTGLMASLHGKNIYVTKKIGFNTVFCTSDPDYVGVMPVYQDIEVIPADIPWKSSFGWVMNELVGAAIFNPKGVAKITVSA